MNRRSYINRQRTYRDQLHSCTWCGRDQVDVLEIAGTGAGEILCECVNRRACMKERTIQAIKARDERAAALERAAAKPAANDAPRCQVCHRRDHRPGDMNAGHAYAAWTLPGLVTAFDAEAARMRATMGDQRPLFGAEAVVGPGQLPGQLSLFAGGE